MTWVAIGALVAPVRRAGPDRSRPTFTYVDLSSLDSKSKTITESSEIRTDDAPSRARQNLEAGDVLVSTVRPNLNGVATVPASLDQSIGSTGFSVLRPRPELLDGRYLFHWVRTAQFVEVMTRLATGASYPAVTDATVKRSLLPLPPLPEQRRIAAILDETDALRTRAITAAAVLRESLDSEFQARFFTGPSSAPRRPFGQLGRVVTGKTPPGSVEGMYGDAVPFATPGDLESEGAPQRWLSSAGAETVPRVRKGSLLVCCIGATIGKMGVARSDTAFNQQINAVEWGADVLPAYGLFAGRSLRRRIIGMAPTTTLPILPKSKFAALQIPVPSLELQQEFEDVTRAHSESAAAFELRKAQIDALFASLQQRAFRGEL